MQIIDIINSTIDNVQKLIFKNTDSSILEVSYIRKNDGKDILCVPTQTNCNMGCTFCHLTGLNVPVKNLSENEIFNLVSLTLDKIGKHNPTLLISYMGAGEPLMNVDNVINSASHIANIPGYSTIRYAVATLIPGIKPFEYFKSRVIETNLNFKLHWSLHSTNAPVRRSLMPSALDFCKAANLISGYFTHTKRPVEIHYTLMDNINDQSHDVDNLDKLIANKDISIKLLRFAPKENEPNLKESNNAFNFKSALESKGFTVEMYSPPGRDIGSSCGQFILDKYR